MKHNVNISSWVDKRANFTEFDFKQKCKTDVANLDDLMIVSQTINYSPVFYILSSHIPATKNNVIFKLLKLISTFPWARAKPSDY
jgi:hypothetical protein